jgi:hypothetical protein
MELINNVKSDLRLRFDAFQKTIERKSGFQNRKENFMQDLKRWFVCLIIILPLHLAEQFLTGLDELYELKGQLAVIYGWFQNSDYVTVAFVGIVVMLVFLLVYGTLIGGRPRLFAVGFFAFSGCVEIHHVVKTIILGAYFPGAVTAIPFVAFGLLLLRAIAREFRKTSESGAPALESQYA